MCLDLEELGPDERPETYVAEQKAIGLFDNANDLYNEMDWIACYNVLDEARDWVKRMVWSTQDITAPVISSWGITPEISTAGFQVQAQVNDDLAGVENVTVIVRVDSNYITKYLCVYSNGEWSTSVPAIIASTSIDVWIEAWDWGMNRGESNHARLFLGGHLGSELLTIIAIIGSVAVVIIIVIVTIKRR